MPTSEIKQIDNLLADENSGCPCASGFLPRCAVGRLESIPAGARQSMISSAEALVSFSFGGGAPERTVRRVNTEIRSTVETVNSYAQQIAELNQRIVLAQAGNNQQPNDLLDQRDYLVAELNKLVEVKARVDSDGSYSVFYGNGQQLVVGATVSKLVVQASYSDITRMVVGVQNRQLPSRNCRKT